MTIMTIRLCRYSSLTCVKLIEQWNWRLNCQTAWDKLNVCHSLCNRKRSHKRRKMRQRPNNVAIKCVCAYSNEELRMFLRIDPIIKQTSAPCRNACFRATTQISLIKWRKNANQPNNLWFGEYLAIASSLALMMKSRRGQHCVVWHICDDAALCHPID